MCVDVKCGRNSRIVYEKKKRGYCKKVVAFLDVADVFKTCLDYRFFPLAKLIRTVLGQTNKKKL